MHSGVPWGRIIGPIQCVVHTSKLPTSRTTAVRKETVALSILVHPTLVSDDQLCVLEICLSREKSSPLDK